MILVGLFIISSMYQVSPSQAAKANEFPMLPHCDSSRKREPSDHMHVVLNPTLPSDTLTRVPPLKTKSKDFVPSEDEVYEFYIGKRGREIKHGLYQRVPKDISQGKVIEAGYYAHNVRIGKWVTWYPTGEVQTEREYLNGVLNGKHVGYHENGLISEQQDLVDGRPNCKEGHSFGYHENGKLHFEIRIRDGFIIQDSRFDTLGNPFLRKEQKSN